MPLLTDVIDEKYIANQCVGSQKMRDGLILSPIFPGGNSMINANIMDAIGYIRYLLLQNFIGYLK